MSNAYYGSLFADQAVRAYRAWCRQKGFVCDEPGAGGVRIMRARDGRELVEVRNRDGKVFRCVRLANGRLQQLSQAPVSSGPSRRRRAS